MKVPVGFALPPCAVTLDVVADVIRADVDFFELTPETTWRHMDSAGLGDGEAFPHNDYADLFERILRDTGAFAVAHGVDLSMGSARPDPVRRAAWLRSVARDHRRFDFRWYTDHLAVTEMDGTEVTLPIALPWTAEAEDAVAASLDAMAGVVPEVGFETTAFYFVEGSADDEAAWIGRTLARANGWLLLDLYNVFANGVNHGFDPERYIDALPLERVIEIHVAGGVPSSPDWLPGGATMLLDGHDAPVPEEVWLLLRRVLPRCPGLRGVLLERMAGTIDRGNVAAFASDMERLRREVAIA